MRNAGERAQALYDQWADAFSTALENSTSQQTDVDGDVQRIVVAAPIKIGSNSYYMGVMLQRDNQNQTLYLHNVAIEKETSKLAQADLLTTGADANNEHLFITSILQNALIVKYKKSFLRTQQHLKPKPKYGVSPKNKKIQ